MALALFALFVVPLGALAIGLASRVRHRWLRIAVVGAEAVVGVPVLIVLGLVSARLANDLRLKRFAGQVLEYPLPPDSSLAGHAERVGVLTGNGNHCDFVVTCEIASSLPLEAVRAHYAGLHLRPAIEGGASVLPSLDVQPRKGGGYVVTAVDAPYEGSLDLRCH